jgi:hypothetical protein
MARGIASTARILTDPIRSDPTVDLSAENGDESAATEQTGLRLGF